MIFKKGRKKKRTKNTNEPKKPFELNLLHFIGIGLLLALVAAFLGGHAYQGVGVRLGLVGSYVWVVGMTVAFILQLMFLARLVLPPDAGREESDRLDPESRERGWREGVRLILLSFVLPILPQSLTTFLRGPATLIPDGLPLSFALFRSGIVASHLALILARENEFTRAVGPGYVRLNRGERITHLVDLRRQQRRVSVRAVSADGIPLQTTIGVAFWVRRSQLPGGDDPAGNLPYSYSREAILRLAFTESRTTETNRPWPERLAAQAATNLVAQLSRYRLDQLYLSADQQNHNEIVPLGRLEEQVKRDLDDQLLDMFDCRNNRDQCPVEILRIRVAALTPPAEIIEQRIESWKTTLQQRIALRQAEGAAEEIRSLTAARARAQLEMLESLTENILTMHQAYEADLSQIVMLRMIEAMDEAMSDTEAREKFPAGMMTTLNQLNNWLRRLPAGEMERLNE